MFNRSEAGFNELALDRLLYDKRQYLFFELSWYNAQFGFYYSNRVVLGAIG